MRKIDLTYHLSERRVSPASPGVHNPKLTDPGDPSARRTYHRNPLSNLIKQYTKYYLTKHLMLFNFKGKFGNSGQLPIKRNKKQSLTLIPEMMSFFRCFS